MHPPLAALLWLIFAPPLLLLGGRVGVVGAALAALGALLIGPALAAAQAILLGGAAALALAFLTRPAQREHVGALLWCAIVTLPAWAPAHPALWRLWPAAALANEHWDPARGGLLYEKWGSAMALPEVAFMPAWLMWLAAAVAARAVAARMMPRHAGSAPGSSA